MSRRLMFKDTCMIVCGKSYFCFGPGLNLPEALHSVTLDTQIEQKHVTGATNNILQQLTDSNGSSIRHF